MEKQVGRPRVEVDYELVLRLRDVENLGWSRGAEAYRNGTGQWISRDTFKRRYHEAKAMSPLELVIRVMQWKQKMRETAARQR
jgi:hypothetical protein